jgi:hypothetical protein
MTHRSKVAPDAIERAHRALEGLPQHQPDELTKAQAIKELLGAIRATRSKGYSLAAIGKMLSECGIPITTGALRAYLSDASGAGGKKKRRRATPRADDTIDGVLASFKRPGSAATGEPATTPGGATSAAPSPEVDLDWERTAPSGNSVAVDVHQTREKP